MVVGMGVKDGLCAVVEEKKAETVGVLDANAAPVVDRRDSTRQPVGVAEVRDMEPVKVRTVAVKRAPHVEKLSVLVFVKADHDSRPFM